MAGPDRRSWQGSPVRTRPAADNAMAACRTSSTVVLAGLSEAPDQTLRMSQLAQFAEGQLPRLSQVAARLEQRGWLVRRGDPSDGRSILATLTEAGLAVVVATAPGHVAAVRERVFDQLNRAQVRQLHEICRRIGTHLRIC